MTIDDALAQFLLQLEADGRSPHTTGQYQRHVRAFTAWWAQGGHADDVAAIGPRDVAQFFAGTGARERCNGGTKRPTSLNAMRTSLRVFFCWLRDAGLVAENPARLLRRARCSPPPPRGLHADEQQRLLGALATATGPEAERDRMLFTLLLRSGLRVGSAVGLDVEDLDLDHGEVHVRSAKGGRPNRTMVPVEVGAALKSWVGERTTGPVFLAKGRRISTRHVQRRFAAWLERAGVERKASPHSLRHSFATLMLERTGNLELVRRALNHASIASTVIYVGHDDRALREAVGA